MSIKLDKGVFPKGHTAEDFKCFGPVAEKDGEFSNCKIADLGCFTQDGKDTNKAYHACVCQSNVNSKWYAYYEWGRTGSSKNDFQFTECSDESEAQEEFESQLMSKNVKRGEWTTVAGIKTLKAKAGKDCYLVRKMAARNIGLPDGRKISNEIPKVVKTSVSSKASSKYDSETLSLLKDLNLGTLNYTRSVISGDSIPSSSAIDEARTLLDEAQKRIGKIGNVLTKQVKDKELIEITNLIYSRIPKVKTLKADDSEWILSSDNIFNWRQDLDAFEASLSSVDVSDSKFEDPLAGFGVSLSYIDIKSNIGQYLSNWWVKATLNKHSYLGKMNIKNIWQIEKSSDQKKFDNKQSDILKDNLNPKEKPLFQIKKRIDVSNQDVFDKTNTHLLFHGTRSVNVSGIIKKSLMLPKNLNNSVQITGSLFGSGAYFADDWKKSAGYTSLNSGYYTSGSGGIKGRSAFMFAADVILGNPYVASYKAYSGPPKDHHSIFGKAGVSGVQNNEWIVFDTNQILLKYLIEFDCK